MLAVLAGLALLAGHEPVGWGWAGLVALVPLSLLARDVSGGARPLRAGVGWGLVAGVVFFGPLLWWIHNIGEVVAWPLLSAALAPFVAAWVALLAWWGDRRGRAVLAVAAWVALEMVRTVAPLGGFPWGQLGYTQANGGPFLEAARSVGVLGITGLLAAVAVAVERTAVAVTRAVRTAPAASDTDRLAVLPGADHVARAGSVPLAVMVGLLVVGTLARGAPPEPTGETVDVAAIQGFGVQGSTGRELGRSRAVADGHLALTRQVAASAQGPPDFAVWPENALDHGVLRQGRNPELRDQLEAALAALDGAPLLAGMIQDRPNNRFVNSMVAFDGDGGVLGRYDKRQYVPFGEYIPFRELIEWLPPLQRVPRDGIEGDGPVVMDLAGAPVGSVICFEVVWPGLVHDQVAAGAQMLVVGTNNSSFGESVASDQHIAFSQLRAVETGRWVVHAALSGRSALVAPDGSVHQRTGLFEQAVVRDEVPLIDERTMAMGVGNAPGWIAVLATVGMIGARLATRRRPAATPADAEVGQSAVGASLH